MHQPAKRMRDNAMRHARNIGNKARANAMKRKEEYLGARVPKELRDKVIAQADRLEIPVSILIRNILEEAFASADQDGTATSRPREENRTNYSYNQGNDRYPTVIGWEVMTLNRPMTCTGCGKELIPGSAITLGLAGPGESHVILCSKCKQFA
jgi:hypothetical protein